MQPTDYQQEKSSAEDQPASTQKKDPPVMQRAPLKPLKAEARNKLLDQKRPEKSMAEVNHGQFEPLTCSSEVIKERCSPPAYIGYTTAAVFASAAIAGVVLPDCKADPDPGVVHHTTLQFVVRYSCGEIFPPFATILLPNMTIFQSYNIGTGNNPSNVLNDPPNGTYTITLIGVENPVECFTVDVIVDGVTVVTNGSFSVVPTITFTYPL